MPWSLAAHGEGREQALRIAGADQIPFLRRERQRLELILSGAHDGFRREREIRPVEDLGDRRDCAQRGDLVRGVGEGGVVVQSRQGLQGLCGRPSSLACGKD